MSDEHWVVDADADRIASIVRGERHAPIDQAPELPGPHEGPATHHLYAAAQRPVQTCCRRADHLVGEAGRSRKVASGSCNRAAS